MSLELSQERLFKRKLVHREYAFYGTFTANIMMVARIRGDVSVERLETVIQTMPKRHPLLRVKIIRDENGEPWFTSEGVAENHLITVERTADDQWKEICTEEFHRPFVLNQEPLIRYTLVYSPELSELIITIHHIIGDGMSLAYLTRDILFYLGNPDQEIEYLPDPPIFDVHNLPVNPSVNFIVRFILTRFNRKWQESKVHFDEEDMKAITEVQTNHFKTCFLPWQLTEAQTSKFIAKCKKEGVTVNAALLTLFIAAQEQVGNLQPNAKHLTIVPVNIRERLPTPPGESFGYYASGYEVEYKYNARLSFWENVRLYHQKLKKEMTDENIFKDMVLMYYYMDPSMMYAMKFFLVGKLVSPESPRYEKLSNLSKDKGNIINKVIKSKGLDKLDSSNAKFGVLVTNIGKMTFPETYNSLELDSLMLVPGSNRQTKITLSVVTASGKMNIALGFLESVTDKNMATKIKTKAMSLLQREVGD